LLPTNPSRQVSGWPQAPLNQLEATDRKQRSEREAAAAHEDSIQLRRTVTALAAMLGENVEDSMGLTEAVQVLCSRRRHSLLMMWGITER
jgi:hypothetical protein